MGERRGRVTSQDTDCDHAPRFQANYFSSGIMEPTHSSNLSFSVESN